jgi:hypothetical protein
MSRAGSRNAGGDFDGVTIKYGPDPGTAPLWARIYANGHGDDEAAAIAVDAAGNVHVAGRSKGNGTGFDYFTVRYDSGGAERWAQRYDNIKGVDEAAAVALDGAGNVLVTGRSEGTGTGFDFLTVKYDSSGRTVWRAGTTTSRTGLTAPPSRRRARTSTSREEPGRGHGVRLRHGQIQIVSPGRPAGGGLRRPSGRCRRPFP